MLDASVKPATRVQYRAAGARFYAYVQQVRANDKQFPTLKSIMNSFNLFQLDVLLRSYLAFKFNNTFVQGGTLNSDSYGILHCLAVDYGILISGSLLPSIRKVCKGADNILKEYFGGKPKGKFPILNPILEAMLKHATEWERWAILLAQRFCLRSQHYCNNQGRAGKDPDSIPNGPHYLRRKDLKFIPNINNPRAISIVTACDKNNPDLHHMERTVYCTCGSRWTCIVHEAQKLFSKYNMPPNAALAQCRQGDMHYNAMLHITKQLISKIGLDPADYGTHSYRSGGTSELIIEGRPAIYVQNFCWWKNIGSVLIYVKPNSPDLLKFVTTFSEYRESRLRDMGLVDKLGKYWDSIFTEVKTQSNKRNRAVQQQRIVGQVAQCQAPVRGAINNLVRGTVARTAASFTNMHRRPVVHQYTDYSTWVNGRNPAAPAGTGHTWPLGRIPPARVAANPPVLTSVGWLSNPYRH